MGLNIRLKGYVYRQHLHRWIWEWFYYNLAAGTFNSNKLCSRLYSIKLEFNSQKTTNSLFETPFCGVRGEVSTSTIDR